MWDVPIIGKQPIYTYWLQVYLYIIRLFVSTMVLLNVFMFSGRMMEKVEAYEVIRQH